MNFLNLRLVSHVWKLLLIACEQALGEAEKNSASEASRPVRKKFGERSEPSGVREPFPPQTALGSLRSPKTTLG